MYKRLCDAAAGCVYQPDDTACTDDDVACTVESCDWASGCEHWTIQLAMTVWSAPLMYVIGRWLWKFRGGCGLR